MRIRFARRPPLFRGEKSTKLSPFSADKPLDFVAFSRTTPAARMRPISARRASADMRSGHRGLGPEIGVSGTCDMATFRDWDDGQKVSRNQENTSVSIICVVLRGPCNSCEQMRRHCAHPTAQTLTNHPAQVSDRLRIGWTISLGRMLTGPVATRPALTSGVDLKYFSLRLRRPSSDQPAPQASSRA